MHLVLFDMDHTLVACDTGTRWSEFLAERGLISGEKLQQRQQFLHDYNNGTLNAAASYRFELEILQGFPPLERSELLNEFFELKIMPMISPKALALVAGHQAAGDFVVMITATLDEIARPVAKFFAFEHLIASRGVRDAAGNYTGEVEVEPCMGRGKLVHLEEWLTSNDYKPKHYVFYSDSHNDLPLLEQVDIAIAVDPDEQLRRVAEQNNWEIISFRDR